MKRNAWNCEHTDRQNRAKGLCRQCYTKMNMSTKMQKATKCSHTDRPHMAFGLCARCYRLAHAKQNPVLASKCEHTDQPHAALGLCQRCYERHRQAVYTPPTNSVMSKCHPDRPNVSNEMCGSCHRKWRESNIKENDGRRIADCHPEKPAVGRDKAGTNLCRSCYRVVKYGLTLDQVIFLLMQQSLRCIVCTTEISLETLHIDHDHQTKKVRGLLCHRCNKGLGFFDDSLEGLKRAVQYLENNRDVQLKLISAAYEKDEPYCNVPEFESHLGKVVQE